MKISQAFHALGLRLSKPALWGSALALAATAFILLHRSPAWDSMSLGHRWMAPWSLLIQLVLLFGASPLPWQWTGDSRSMAPAGRGLFQMLCFMAFSQGTLWLFAPKQEFPNLQTGLLLLGLHGSLFGAIGWFIARREARMLERAILQERTKEAAWEQLRAQLSPHVLLNVLNGLAQLVMEDAARASHGLKDLAEVHRRLVEFSRRGSVSLAEERNLTEHYLAVEALRLEGRLQVDWDWKAELDSLTVLPFLLQPLVENAIKHGIAPSEGLGRLLIRGERISQDIRLEVRNTGRIPGQSTPGTGLGLRNLQGRLHLAYGPQASLELSRVGDWTVASLTLPLSDSSHA